MTQESESSKYARELSIAERELENLLQTYSATQPNQGLQGLPSARTLDSKGHEALHDAQQKLDDLKKKYADAMQAGR